MKKKLIVALFAVMSAASMQAVAQYTITTIQNKLSVPLKIHDKHNTWLEKIPANSSRSVSYPLTGIFATARIERRNYNGAFYNSRKLHETVRRGNIKLIVKKAPNGKMGALKLIIEAENSKQAITIINFVALWGYLFTEHHWADRHNFFSLNFKGILTLNDVPGWSKC